MADGTHPLFPGHDPQAEAELQAMIFGGGGYVPPEEVDIEEASSYLNLEGDGGEEHHEGDGGEEDDEGYEAELETTTSGAEVYIISLC